MEIFTKSLRRISINGCHLMLKYSVQQQRCIKSFSVIPCTHSQVYVKIIRPFAAQRHFSFTCLPGLSFLNKYTQQTGIKAKNSDMDNVAESDSMNNLLEASTIPKMELYTTPGSWASELHVAIMNRTPQNAKIPQNFDMFSDLDFNIFQRIFIDIIQFFSNSLDFNIICSYLIVNVIFRIILLPMIIAADKNSKTSMLFFADYGKIEKLRQKYLEKGQLKKAQHYYDLKSRIESKHKVFFSIFVGAICTGVSFWTFALTYRLFLSLANQPAFFLPTAADAPLWFSSLFLPDYTHGAPLLIMCGAMHYLGKNMKNFAPEKQILAAIATVIFPFIFFRGPMILSMNLALGILVQRSLRLLISHKSVSPYLNVVPAHIKPPQQKNESNQMDKSSTGADAATINNISAGATINNISDAATINNISAGADRRKIGEYKKSMTFSDFQSTHHRK